MLWRVRAWGPRPWLAAATAALLVLSFCTWPMAWCAWVALVPLLALVERVPLRTAFLWSYVAGVAAFAGILYWLVFVTVPGWVALAAYLGLYLGAFGLAAGWIFHRPAPPLQRLVLLAALWVVLEWVRGIALTGFGWALLGYSQYRVLPLIQIADLTGAYGVSFLVVWVNVAIWSVARVWWVTRQSRRTVQRAVIAGVAGALAVAIAAGYGAVALRAHTAGSPGRTLRVAVVQGNIPQHQKWDPAFQQEIVARYLGLTRAAAVDGPELIVWPETAFPGVVTEEAALWEPVRALVAELGIPLLVGSPHVRRGLGTEAYFNSALLLSREGTVAGRYDKLHLVPFGEYVPWPAVFRVVRQFVALGDFVPGQRVTVFELAPGVHLSALICFEDVFPTLVRRFARAGAELLVVMTNDAWFGSTAAAYQHAQASVFRAVEHRITVVRAANTGLSAFVRPTGAIVGTVRARTGRELFVAGHRTETVRVGRRVTVYAQWGDAFVALCVILAVWGCRPPRAVAGEGHRHAEPSATRGHGESRTTATTG